MFRRAAVVMLVLTASPVLAQDGAALYGTYCAQCHDGGLGRVPPRRMLGEMTPERIVAALESGSMRAQGAERSPDERRAIAVFLTGKPLGALAAVETAPRCSMPPAPFAAAPRGQWTSWSPTPTNDRYQAQPGIAAAWTGRWRGVKGLPCVRPDSGGAA